MILLVSGATATVRRCKEHKNLGAFITPQAGNTPPTDMIWAADNAAYSNWDETKFVKMLEKIKDLENKPVFVACPDVVGDAIKTAKLFKHWQPIIKGHGLPVALVLQDGQESIGVPWNLVDAIFIGGTDEFKLNYGYIKYIAGVAKSKSKWVHVGRVNSEKRIKFCMKIGVDSIDGTSCSMFPDTYIPKFLRFLEKEQLGLF